ncbi:MAG: 2-C-methyl-D-erythritol 2,4-cyclodiphosphate synthase [Clostridia bacterium]|nr:2-C-methyl-D-erythritol 2,4-cyclodiphosphate synthase [Clostridia bacterium]
MRIGFGYDSHRMVEERKLILGGVEIPFEKGLYGHSDADVLTHAIIDAVFGAEAKGDIGRHFPDNDPAYKDINSMVLLEKAVSEMDGKIVNVDCTLLIQKPKMAPYIDKIRESLAKGLNTDIKNVSVKAKTEEGMEAVGRGEMVKAYAVVLID